MGKHMLRLFLLPVCLFVIPAVAMSEEELRTPDMVRQERIVLEDGTQEFQRTPVTANEVSSYMDERYRAIRERTRLKINGILTQIRTVENPGDAGELQKQIERIKRDGNIERLSFMHADAEKLGQSERAGEYSKEISRLQSGATPRLRSVGNEPDQQSMEQLKGGSQ